jgi:5'-nucleotidase
VIVAVTHLAFEDDRRLVEQLPAIDLVVGGHEHFPITATENRTLISKAGSDARWVARIDVNRRRASGTLERFYELIPISSAIPDDSNTATVVASYEKRLGTELDAVVGSSTVPLDAESVRLRAGETNLGDFVADAVRAEAKADVAIVNAGTIRGDRVFAAGPLTRRTIVDMHPFGNVICTVAASGRILLQALNNGAAKLPAAAGQFAQVSGLTYTIDRSAPPGDRIRNVQVNGQPLNTDRTYTIAIPDFLLKGGDNYTMFSGRRVLVAPEGGPMLVNAIEKAVVAQSPIAPRNDGRITIR